MGAPQSNVWKSEKYLGVVIHDSSTTWSDDSDFKNWLGIRELNAYEAFRLASMYDAPEHGEAKRLAGLSVSDAVSDEDRRVKKETGGVIHSAWFDTFLYRTPVFVDLALDDETLKAHFELWLRIQRALAAERGFEASAFKKVDADVLTDWHQKRLLAAFDLMNWREVSGVRYSDAAIARWLWPDSGPLSDGTYVDRSERFRKVTKPLANRVDWHTISRLEYLATTDRLMMHLATLNATN
jgi:hypothetical protein